MEFASEFHLLVVELRLFRMRPQRSASHPQLEMGLIGVHLLSLDMQPLFF